ncbi:MAG: hypothetical protein Q8922_00670 [Bacteroidota bacterium]|nr:hypothetical protein [Bacteroidota bacterium]MDP4232545.1 hypothetical protein [Bacteroidota bacterium]MDP4243000.1 hypothetical protein [Bacteroidota bacterium]MDP4286425.1 hypothetical protein [Bacteroidota bacterium]
MKQGPPTHSATRATRHTAHSAVRSVTFPIFSFALGGAIFVASHMLAGSDASAAGTTFQLQAQVPTQRPATPVQQPVHPIPHPANMTSVNKEERPRESRVTRKTETREAIIGRQNDPARRQDLCRKLEQRRQELREREHSHPAR